MSKGKHSLGTEIKYIPLNCRTTQEYPKTTGVNYSKTVTSGFMQVGAMQGWQCPICKRILSPWTQECPCKGQIPTTLTTNVTTTYNAPNDEEEYK